MRRCSLSVQIAQWVTTLPSANTGAQDQGPGVLLRVLLCLLEGSGSAGRSACVLFGRKFEVSRGVWVEMLQKAAGSHEKPTGEVWAEGKQLGDTGLCADSYQSRGRPRQSEECRELGPKPQGPPAKEETQQSSWLGRVPPHFSLGVNALPLKASHGHQPAPSCAGSITTRSSPSSTELKF